VPRVGRARSRVGQAGQDEIFVDEQAIYVDVARELTVRVNVGDVLLELHLLALDQLGVALGRLPTEGLSRPVEHPGAWCLKTQIAHGEPVVDEDALPVPNAHHARALSVDEIGRLARRRWSRGWREGRRRGKGHGCATGLGGSG
jgi:hypothetical protein